MSDENPHNETTLSKFCRKYGHNVPSFQFEPHSFFQLNVVVDLDELPNSLMRQVAFLRSAAEKGWFDDTVSWELQCEEVPQSRAAVMIALLDGISKSRRFHHFKLATGPNFPVAGLTRLCTNQARHLSAIAVTGTLGGDRNDFEVWASALSDCTRLSRFEICDQPDGNRQAHQTAGRVMPTYTSKWDCVLRSIANQFLRVGRISGLTMTINEEHMNLSPAVSQAIVRAIKRDERRYEPQIKMGKMKLHFTELDDAATYCVHVARCSHLWRGDLRVRFIGQAHHSSFVRGLIGIPQFSISFVESRRNYRGEAPKELDVLLSKELMDPERLASAIIAKANLPQLLVDMVVGDTAISNNDRKSLYLFARMDREGLMHFDPDRAKNEEWILMLAALGGITLGVDIRGRVDHDLNPLFNLINGHLDKVIGALGLGELQSSVDVLAENSSLRESNAVLIAENASLHLELEKLRALKVVAAAGTKKDESNKNQHGPKEDGTAEAIVKPKYDLNIKISKTFPGFDKPFKGTIESFDPKSGFYHIKYEDGDEEDLTEDELDDNCIKIVKKRGAPSSMGKSAKASDTTVTSRKKLRSGRRC